MELESPLPGEARRGASREQAAQETDALLNFAAQIGAS